MPECSKTHLQQSRISISKGRGRFKGRGGKGKGGEGKGRKGRGGKGSYF